MRPLLPYASGAWFDFRLTSRCWFALLAAWLAMASATSIAAADPPKEGANAAATSPSSSAASLAIVESPEARLGSVLDELRERHGLPALWAGKFQVDGRHATAASGVRKWGDETPVVVDDLLHLGSCTKAMTAAMIGQLISAGQLDFETRLDAIFADIPELVESDWAAVTIVELLEHRSGAPPNARWEKLHADHPQDVVAARRAMLQWLVKQRRPKQARYLYSNVGYALLGHVIEKLDGCTWEAAIARRLFEPLEMRSAGFGPPTSPDRFMTEDGQDNANDGAADRSPVSPASGDAESSAHQSARVRQPWGHVGRENWRRWLGRLTGERPSPDYEPLQTDNPPPLGPAGRVHASLQDWAKFTLSFASEAGCERIGIRPEVSARLLRPTGEGEYAGGWILLQRPWGGGRVLFHNGSNTTWYCVAFVAPEKGYCLLAAANTAGRQAFEGCDAAVSRMIDFQLVDARK